MAGQKLETTISMTDKFSKTVADFEKKLYHTLKPINSLEKSFKRLGDAFALKELGKSFNMLKSSSTEFFFNIRNIGQSFGYTTDGEEPAEGDEPTDGEEPVEGEDPTEGDELV